MKHYLISLGVGLLAGLLYSVLGVRSPAPPVIALVGLFGMLLGEQAVPIVRTLFPGGATFAHVRNKAAEQVLGAHAAQPRPEEPLR